MKSNPIITFPGDIDQEVEVSPTQLADLMATGLTGGAVRDERIAVTEGGRIVRRQSIAPQVQG